MTLWYEAQASNNNIKNFMFYNYNNKGNVCISVSSSVLWTIKCITKMFWEKERGGGGKFILFA